jgi:hypothetical protein
MRGGLDEVDRVLTEKSEKLKQTTNNAVTGQGSTVVADFVKDSMSKGSDLLVKGMELMGLTVDNKKQSTNTTNGTSNEGVNTTVRHEIVIKDSSVMMDYTRRTWEEQLSKTDPTQYATDPSLSIPK